MACHFVDWSMSSHRVPLPDFNHFTTDIYKLQVQNTLICVSEPDAPGAPQNITEGQTVIRDNKIYLTIHWDPPRTSDLPVNRYKVRFWMSFCTARRFDVVET